MKVVWPETESRPSPPYKVLCELAGGIDLRNNHYVEDLGNGMARVVPIDRTKPSLADGAELVDSLSREQLIEILDRRRDIIMSHYAEPQ